MPQAGPPRDLTHSRDASAALRTAPRAPLPGAAPGPTRLPRDARVVVVGAGFAGLATARALGELGLGPGLVLERESVPGAHASGRNAGLARVVEPDACLLALATRSMSHIRELSRRHPGLLRATGSLTLDGGSDAPRLDSRHAALRGVGIATELLTGARARRRWSFLRHLRFESALWCPADGVVDVHALLLAYLDGARELGYALHLGTAVDELLVENGAVRGVRVGDARVRADVVIDATGAWAGRIAGDHAPLPLRPLRRHLHVTGPAEWIARDAPHVWMLEPELYVRREGDGLLLSPCDETPWVPEVPPVDAGNAEILAEKLAAVAPGLGDLTLRTSWACLRTFAPDRRPVIGPDPRVAGLFHVSGLGGSGMTSSAAVGELAAALVQGGGCAWMDAGAVAPARLLVRDGRSPPRSSHAESGESVRGCATGPAAGNAATVLPHEFA